MSGYTGQFSFGHAAFFGTGAYASSVLLTKYGISPWLGMLAGAAAALLIGLFIGFLSFRFRLKGAYFALATLAFAEILRQIIQNSAFFNKTMGILIPLDPNPLMYQFSSRIPYYYVILILTTLITLLVYKVSKSKLGFNLVAIRENEDAARSLGVDAYRNKMIAIGLSSALTALGGTFYAQYLLLIEPPLAFSSEVSIAILLPAIIGGAGTVLGPVVGSFVITPLGEVTNALFSGTPGVQFIVYGAILVLVILFLPEGIVGWVLKRMRQKHVRQGTEPEQATGKREGYAHLKR
jgi:branched-chain amino acid transport system permease protein